MRRALARAADRAGIDKRVHPQPAVPQPRRQARKGGRLEVVQRQPGHARLDTTVTYVGHLSAADLVDYVDSLGDWMVGA